MAAPVQVGDHPSGPRVSDLCEPAQSLGRVRDGGHVESGLDQNSMDTGRELEFSMSVQFAASWYVLTPRGRLQAEDNHGDLSGAFVAHRASEALADGSVAGGQKP